MGKIIDRLRERNAMANAATKVTLLDWANHQWSKDRMAAIERRGVSPYVITHYDPPTKKPFWRFW